MTSTTGSSVASTKGRLIEIFGEDVLGAGREDSLAECLSLSRLYSLDPQDLFYKFEAFALSSLPKDARLHPTLADFQALRKKLQTSPTGDHSGVSQTPKKDNLFGNQSSASRQKIGLGSLFGANTPARGQGNSYQTPSRPAGTAFSAPAIGRSVERSTATAGHDSMDVDGVGADSSRRTNAAAEAWEIKQTLNASIPPSPASSSTASRVKLAQGRDPNSFPSRYMFERRGERGEALDDQLDLVTTLLIETYGLSEEDISDPSIVSQESVYAVGRICPALNPNSASAKDQQQTGLPRLQPIAGGMLIESSKLQGAGQRVPIWFTKECVIRRPPGAEDDGEVATATSAELLGLFPGMLVGIKGRNGGGDGFGVEEVLLSPPLPQAATAPSALLAAQYGTDQLNGGPLDIVVASGPYTSDDDLEFHGFHNLMDNVERERPDALVLLGPFVSIEHPKLLTSSLLPSELFHKHFASRLNKLSPTAKSHTSIVLVPHVQDAVSAHNAWPQPAYDKVELGLAKGTRVLPNPAFFSVSGIIVGTSSADVVRDLRAEEVVVRIKKQANSAAAGSSGPAAGSEDVIARAVRHVLSQRSFYPLFPPPQPKGNSSEAPLPLSLPHIHLASFASVTPDVLILPSAIAGGIQPFAKIVDGTVVINPGRLSDGGNDRSLVNAAKLSIRPTERGELEKEIESGDGAREAAVYERCRVDLLHV